MKMTIKEYLQMTKEGILNIFHPSVILLIVPALTAMFFLDPVIAKTFVYFLLATLVGSGLGAWIIKIAKHGDNPIANAIIISAAIFAATLLLK